jgi:hypothetical protein
MPRRLSSIELDDFRGRFSQGRDRFHAYIATPARAASIQASFIFNILDVSPS